MKLKLKFLKPCLLAGFAAGLLAQAHALPTLTKGHTDVGNAYEDGAWDLHVHDEEHDREYEPGGAILQVARPAQQFAPTNVLFTSILGAAGSPVWILPQAEDPDLLFLGIGAEEMPVSGLFVSNQFRFALASVTGPGEFALYTVNGFGVPTARMNTRDGVDTNDVITVPTGGHSHFNWAFSAPGTYTLSFQATATLDDGTNTFVDSGPVAYTFVVLADTNKPTVAITAPAANSTTNPINLTLTGTARDNGRVQQVRYSLNGAPFTAATVTNPAANIFWSAALTLADGLNTVVVKAIDRAGNESVSVARTFYFHNPSPFTLNIVGGGTVAPTATAYGTPTNDAALFVGRSYELNAVPTPGNLFSNWVVQGGSTTTSTNPKLNFTMQSNLTATAYFVTNHFLAKTGAYNGLFSVPSGPTYSNAGFFTVKVSVKDLKLATFSGSLSFAGEKRSFSGSFDLAGHGVSKPFTFKSHPGLTNRVTLSLPFDGSDTITGTLTNNTGAWVANLLGDRQLGTNSWGAYPALTNSTGRYTMIIPGSANAATEPAGHGYALVFVTNGLVTVGSSYLGEGTALSQKVPLSKNGDWPWFSQGITYTNSGVKIKGSVVMGWLSLTNKVLTGTNHWIKVNTGYGLYPAGFELEEGLNTSVYTNAALSTNRVIELTSGSNGVVILKDGNLLTPVTNNVYLSILNKFTSPFTNNAGGTNKLSVSLDTKTGKIGGSVRFDGVTSTKLAGAVVQDENKAYGYFLRTNESGSLLLQNN